MKTNDLSKLGTLMRASGSQQHAAKAKETKLKKLNAGHKTSSSRSAEKRSKSGKSEDFVLHRNIDVFCWNVKATISKAAKRDDLLPVLRRTQENNGTYGKDIASHLLGEEVGREAVGVRLLDVCESLGLLVNQGERSRPRYYLTEEGEEALKSGCVMVPEEGTWTIWASNDPVLNYPVLRVEPFRECSAYHEIKGDKKGELKNRNENFEDTSRWLRDACSVVNMPAAIGNELIRLDKIDTKVECIDSNAQLTLEWIPKANYLEISGSIDGSSVNATPQAPDVSFNTVWQELLENERLWGQWEKPKERLLLSFDSTKGAERSLMQRQLEFAKPRLYQFGNFGPTCRTVAIFPKSQEDAQQWAEWKLQNQINTYATESVFPTWREEALRPFDEYSDTIELPTRDELAFDIWEKRDDTQNVSTVWHLMAAKDWGV
ncbi:hypothetical protein NX722_18095 [Endozoicomonas gorgoniicola]|uniref:Uncharacterized protein n=1 Tax=Endozoicomonas gorgoniicola TaxID=1234144 RepID=A0ABT3MYQ9_9GAMM|nr:hypothetical protein [Endozoicomonas gorgoniicola]MCW7554499.1 hypothetical protein [Endozoicomonas gorgoniicola]